MTPILTPMEILHLTGNLRRYGVIDFENDTISPTGHHYRTTYYTYNKGFYEVTMKDGEVIDFRYSSLD